MRQPVRFVASAAMWLMALCSPMMGQDPIASITGKVVDPLGAIVARAQVVVTNTDTNSIQRTASNELGFFEVNRLNPGSYSVQVESTGFKKTMRGGLLLSVGSRLDLTFQLEIGQVNEVVQVTAEAPLLDTTTASGGRVIDNRQIRELPVADLNPLVLATLVPGIQWTGQPEFRRSFDNFNMSRFNTAGGVGPNDYAIDGAPATGSAGRVGYMPPAEGVGEFRMETSSFDAAIGHTAGATVNLTSKSGTNTYHGSLFNMHWQQRWNATPHFTRLQFEQDVRTGRKKPDDEKQAPGRSNIFGGSLSGPISVPKLFSGRDKLFSTFTYNGIYQSRTTIDPGFLLHTVPTAAMRAGDFSALQQVDPVRFTVYDPRSARRDGSRIVRAPFPGNRVGQVLNPMYKAYESLLPLPNNVPGIVSREGYNNYFASAMPAKDTFNSLLNRIDYNMSDRHRFNGKWYWNDRTEHGKDWTYETKPGLHDAAQQRVNKGLGANYVSTIGNATVLDIGVSWTRFVEGNNRPEQLAFTPSSVGLPQYVDAKAGDYQSLPMVDLGDMRSISTVYPAIGLRATVGETKAQITTLFGSHSFKFGALERRYWFTSAGPGASSGSFFFNNAFTREADITNTASDLGLSWAAFMLGTPSGMSIMTADSGYWSTRVRSAYFQDEWRASSKLRLTLGLRYEREGGITERFNRGLAGAFDFNYRPPFAAAAEAAYRQNPLPELAPNDFKVMGGNTYLGSPEKTFTNGTHTFLPRVGAVYQMGSKMVLRAGFGSYRDTFNANFTQGLRQDGFSQATVTPVSVDAGLTFCCGVGGAESLSASRNPLTDPFPVRADGTRFDRPHGSSLGGLITQGTGYLFNPRDFAPAMQHRWRIGIQREITKDMVLDVSYNGARSRLPVPRRLNYLPEQHWATGMVRNQNLDNELNRNVPNPFQLSNLAGLRNTDPAAYRHLSTQNFFTSTVRRKHELLRAYPNYTNLTGYLPDVEFSDQRGTNLYHDVQVRFERRFAKGFQTAVMYTYAHGRERDYYLNEFDQDLSWRPADDLRPHRLVWQAIYELPFGKNKRWVSSGFAQHLLGGWQASWIYQIQSGATTNWSNEFYYGDIDNISEVFNHKEVHAKDIHQWFNGNIAYRGSGAVPAGFEGFDGRANARPGTYHVRVFPVRLDALREDGIRGWDIRLQRRFRFGERLSSMVAVDALNATNHTNFAGPILDPTRLDFGRVTAQRGASRVIQATMRVEF